jgi:hypothetical protein
MSNQVSQRNVESRIYRIRGQQVMLDADLADLYGVETRILNQAVKRNLDSFPDDFMFYLTRWEILRISQFVISSGQRQNLKFSKSVAVFTEEGVAMLSGVLRSQRAVHVKIAIMRAFVKMRHAILVHQGIARRLEKLEGKIDIHETDIRLLVQDVGKLKERRVPDDPINPVII